MKNIKFNPTLPTVDANDNENDSKHNNQEDDENTLMYSTNTTEDDIDTVLSDKTSKCQNKNEEAKVVPPSFVRYRLGAAIDKKSLINVTSTSNNEVESLTPSTRFRNIFIELTKYIKSIDSNAVYISWSCDNEFEVLHMDEEKFPKEIVKIATFFKGYKARLKEGTRQFFNFSLHTPNWMLKWMELKLTDWATIHSYSLYKCDI